MKERWIWNRIAQGAVVLAGAFLLKWHYATAGADRLRWILAPTATLVELLTGVSFEFEPHAGYLNLERRFLIADSCAGVNFLITAFLMLSLRRLLGARSESPAWNALPAAALIAYLSTLVANTVRISLALWLQRMPAEFGWAHSAQFHRLEGICIYFGALLLLFAAGEKLRAQQTSSRSGRALWPLLVYYATALGLPLANGADRRAADFREHALFVLLIPWLWLLLIEAFRRARSWWSLAADPVSDAAAVNSANCHRPSSLRPPREPGR
ncbi:MAG TPA: exosortase K [Blastocatellia bacterium]|nr:exosortase K [Blastocatellia bacterium]